MIQVTFSANMQSRFVDSNFARDIERRMVRFYAIAGASVMTTARRSLRGPVQMPLSEMSDLQIQRYRQRQQDYRRKSVRNKARRPDKVSKPGKPPFLHAKPSVLRTRLFFALAPDKQSVVVGPELFRAGASNITAASSRSSNSKKCGPSWPQPWKKSPPEFQRICEKQPPRKEHNQCPQQQTDQC